MNQKEILITKLSKINDPVINAIISSLTKLYQYEKLSIIEDEFLITCDGIKVLIIFNKNEIIVKAIELDGNLKRYQIIYDNELIIFNREYKNNNETIIRKQKYLNNIFLEEEYLKLIANKIVQKTSSFINEDNKVYLSTEYNGNPKKICSITKEPLSLKYTDLIAKDYILDFVIYDSLLKNIEDTKLLENITLAEFNKNHYYAINKKELDVSIER